MLESDLVLKAFGLFRKQQSTAHPERETDVCGLLKVKVEMCLLEVVCLGGDFRKPWMSGKAVPGRCTVPAIGNGSGLHRCLLFHLGPAVSNHR